MKSLNEFYLAHCFKILIIGFALSAVGIIVYAQVQHKDPLWSKIAFSLTASGIGIYIIGRVGLVLQRRKARKGRDTLVSGAVSKQKEEA